MFLKVQPGKYKLEDVIHEITADLQQPFEKTLSENNLNASESYSKNEFYDILSSLSTVTKFRAIALFYDLSQG